MKFDRVTGNGDKEGEDPPHYTNIEYAYYLMAKAGGRPLVSVAGSVIALFSEGKPAA